ncbi:MAG TPA: glycosyltransferase family 2 protein [Candidatus Saccharibacteria bacterium]|nr:glycosyltransferase family 2 protein [Candidatus Saccharibacteria bacterium]
MKLIIQIPCLNEEATLPAVLKTIPKKIDGIDEITTLIIDDGSTDKTIEVAKKHGVKHFVIHSKNMGLARSFHDGIHYALSIGADIVVNTDGDNQYPQEQISDLVQPILRGEAEIVIGDRQTSTIEHFSPIKKLFQRVGSSVVNKAAGTSLPDAASGFRAYSKQSLLRLNIVTQFSYCMETIIQAGNKRIPITSVKIKTNPKTRESRLFKNIWQHMYKSGSAISRSYIMYRPHLIFITLGGLLLIAGLIPFVRYGYIYITGNHGGDHIQSLLLGAVLIFASMIAFALTVIADLTHTNRTLLEDSLERIKELQYNDND